MESKQDFLWVERYRPKGIDDCIIPDRLKKELKSFVADSDIPHMLFTGSPGNGKTSTARAICNEIGADYIFINGSEESGIDTLRNKIKGFASTASLTSVANHKIVLLDEGDYLNMNSTQPALRGLMEEHHRNCRFIITCNAPNRIMKAIRSRCTVVNFEMTSEEKPKIMSQFFKRLIFILEDNSITFDKNVLAQLIKNRFPDFRSIINEVQRYARSGTIDDGILYSVSDEMANKVLAMVRNNKFAEMRKWVDSSPTVDLNILFDKILDVFETKLVNESIPDLILILDEYQDKADRSINPRITLSACLTQMMMALKFK